MNSTIGNRIERFVVSKLKIEHINRTHCYTNLMCENCKNATQAILDLIEQTCLEAEQQHIEVYLWLLGRNGGFPKSEPGKRYNWRTELRERIPKRTLKQLKALIEDK